MKYKELMARYSANQANVDEPIARDPINKIFDPLNVLGNSWISDANAAVGTFGGSLIAKNNK